MALGVDALVGDTMRSLLVHRDYDYEAKYVRLQQNESLKTQSRDCTLEYSRPQWYLWG